MPPESYLDAENPTYHNCVASVTGLSHDNQTAGYWPCLSPKIFNPVNLNPDQWMEASAALGMKEICITAKHQGGFTLWPSKFTPYGVQAATNFQGGKGDPLKQFVAAAKRWNIKVGWIFLSFAVFVEAFPWVLLLSICEVSRAAARALHTLHTEATPRSAVTCKTIANKESPDSTTVSNRCHLDSSWHVFIPTRESPAHKGGCGSCRCATTSTRWTTATSRRWPTSRPRPSWPRRRGC
eukprot:m.426178 g.426178  ORF g.426178 m.426178 type:complete len:238 (-) comp16862_c0_seq28:1132-1845(-)